MVWIAGSDADLAVENRTFGDASVRQGLQAFRTVRIAPSAARADAYLSRYASLAPAMVVFSPDLRRAAFKSGPFVDADSALALLRESATKDLGLDLDAALARSRTLASEEKKVEDLRAALRRSSPEDTARAAELDRRLSTIRTERAGLFRATRGRA